jgi:outer membrane protein assembly factor BamB
MNVHRPAIMIVVLAGASISAVADDWPQWRGPERNGISQETGLLPQWPEEGPKLVWQVKDLGGGYSTPAVVGDRIYIVNDKGNDNESVQALSTADGSVVWSRRIGKVGPNRGPQYPGARSTPTVDGEMLYALGSDGDLACLKTDSGEIAWQKNLRDEEFGGRIGNWQYSESVLVDGDKVVCTPGGDKATLAALHKETGDIVWKAGVPGGDEAAYASIIVVETGGVKQYVQFLQNGVVGVNAENGDFLWRYDGTGRSPANIPTPVSDGELVYTATGRGGSGAVKLAVSGETVSAEQVYYSRELPNSIGGSVLIGDSLYGTNNAGLMCVDFETGERRWTDRCIGAASICIADGMLFLHSEKGEYGDVALIAATPEEYRELGRFTLPDKPQRRGEGWAYPVVANGRLYVHDFGTLWCYDVKGR